jgi:AraC-like DNA-binding protein
MANSNILVIGNQITLYMGLLPNISEHAHSTAVIALSLNGENISARSGSDHQWKDHQAYFLPANIPNEMRQYENPIACIFIEPDSDLYQQFLKQHGFDKNCLSPYRHHLQDLRSTLNTFVESPSNPDEFSLSVVETLHGLNQPLKEIDQRVISCAGIIKEHIGDNLSANELASLFDISERQLSSLFKRDMGLPIRKYRLWSRLKNVAQLVNDGRLITDAAIESGFSDSAHFSNSCRKLLGLKPTDIMETGKPLTLLATTR